MDDVGVLGMVARDGADTVGAEELSFIQHALQNAPQLRFIHQREQATVVDAACGEGRDGLDQLRAIFTQPAHAFHELRQLRRLLRADDRTRRQRQQADQRPHLHAHGPPSGRRSTS